MSHFQWIINLKIIKLQLWFFNSLMHILETSHVPFLKAKQILFSLGMSLRDSISLQEASNQTPLTTLKLDSSSTQALRNMKGWWSVLSFIVVLNIIGFWSNSYKIRCSTNASLNIYNQSLLAIAWSKPSLICPKLDYLLSEVNRLLVYPKSTAPATWINYFRKSLRFQILLP